MIKLPSIENKYYQTNTSDLFGNIYATKNINFDEEGYIKLSDRSIAILSEQDDADADTPTSIGRFNSSTNAFAVGTTDASFNITLSNSGYSVAEDTATNNPGLSEDSSGVWWQNRWHETTPTAMFYKTTIGGNWTDSGVSLTTGKVHDVKVFGNRNKLCITNGNKVEQYDTSYADISLDLSVPTDFELIGLAYNDNQMGIISMLADTISGQNTEALFFIWDGATTEYNKGIGVGSDMCVGIVAYKSSWVILTRTGELKYFNGGGFDTLATLPFYFKDTIWGDSNNREAFTNIMSVEGDVIYININSSMATYSDKGESILPYYPGGVWCFDPKIGLYHRYSPSISSANNVAVADSGVNTTTDVLTLSSGTLYATGNPMKYIDDGDTPIGGLSVGKIYFIIKHTSTTFSLATSKAEALAGNRINLTSVGDTTNNFLALNVIDYGQYRTSRTGAVEQYGTTNNVISHLIYGTELYDSNSSSVYGTVCITSSGFKNIGYVISAKSKSENIEDVIKKVYLKHRPLKTDDKIIIKIKDKDILGIPVSTPQYSLRCTWTDANTFTTTADFSEVETFINDSNGECEVEILAGAGGGQIAQISSISVLNGTYTVNLVDDIDGVSANDTCDVLIDNWRKIGEITSANTKGWEEFAVENSSKWTMFKIELQGSKTTVEEFLAINGTQLKAI